MKNSKTELRGFLLKVSNAPADSGRDRILLTLYNQEGEALIQHIVKGDEMWIRRYTPPTIQQNMMWKLSDELVSRKFKSQLLVNKVLLTVLWDWKGTLY